MAALADTGLPHYGAKASVLVGDISSVWTLRYGTSLLNLGNLGFPAVSLGSAPQNQTFGSADHQIVYSPLGDEVSCATLYLLLSSVLK